MGLFDDVLPAGGDEADAPRGKLFADVLPKAKRATPVSRAVEDRTADMIGVPLRERGERGDLTEAFTRGIVGVGEVGANALKLPLNISDAIMRAFGGDPEQSMAMSGIRRAVGAVSDPMEKFGRDLDRVEYGHGSVNGAQLVEALNPTTDVGIGDRLGRASRFIAETGARSAPEMLAAVGALPGYLAGRVNQVAENRAGNDGRDDVGLTDLAAAAPAAAAEALLERFTTMRLLPKGTTMGTPGVMEAIKRIAKEVGIQAPLGGVEELAPYLAEQAGTERGITPQELLETFAGGAVAEGGIGGVAQGSKEALSPLSRAGLDSAMLAEGRDNLAPAPDLAELLRAAVAATPSAPAPAAAESSRQATVQPPESGAPSQDAQEAPQAPPAATAPTPVPDAPVATADKPRVKLADVEAWRAERAAGKPETEPAPEGAERRTERRRFDSPDDVAKQDYDKRATDLALTDEQRAGMRAPASATDSVTGWARGDLNDVEDTTVERAQKHVWETREPSHYVAADIANLSGINSARGNDRALANKDYRAMADILREELEATGGDIVPMRTGGDELNAVVVNVDRAAVDLAVERAKARVAEYATTNGLADVPREKGGRAGTGFHFGLSEITPEMSIGEIKSRADAGVNASKKEAGHDVNRDATETAGGGSPDARTGRTGDRAPEPGVRRESGGVAQDTRSPEAEPTVSIKNEAVDARRETEGREPLFSPSTKSNQETHDEAAVIRKASPDAWRSTVDRVAGGEPIGATEEAVLQQEYAKTIRERNEAAERAGSDDPVIAEAASKRHDDANEKLDEIERATRAAGTEIARAMQARQRAIRDDYSLAGLERRETARAKRVLRPDELAKLSEMADKLADAQKKLDDLESQREAAGVDFTWKALRDEIGVRSGDTTRVAKARPKLEELKAAADAARERLKTSPGVRNPKNQGGAVDIAAIADYATIGRYHIANGAAKFTDWVAAMTADVGDAFKRLAAEAKRAIFSASKAGPKVDTAQTVDQVVADIKGTPTARDVYNLALAHVRAGADTEAGIVTAVAKSLKVDEKQARALLADAGRKQNPPLAADRAKMRELRELVRIQKEIDDLDAGIKPTMKPPTKTVQAIRDKRTILNTRLRQMAASDPENASRYNAMRADNIKAQIAELDRRLAGGDPLVKPTPTTPKENEHVRRLKAERDSKRKQLQQAEAAVKRASRDPEADYQAKRGRQIQKQIADIKARIAAGDYKPRTRVERQLDANNQILKRNLEDAKTEFARFQFEQEMKERTPLQRLFAVVPGTINLSRALMTSFDFSAVFRQGGFIAFGRPIIAAKAIPKMFAAAASKQKTFDYEEALKARANYPLYKKHGLELTSQQAVKKQDMEEAYQSRLARYIPGIGASSRAFGTFLNVLRADTFDTMHAGLSRRAEPTKAEGDAIANYINVATGRGKIGFKGGNAGEVLNLTFFAPRLVASRFNLLLGQPFLGGSLRTKGLILQEYARFMVGVGATMALASLAYDDEEDGDEYASESERIDLMPKSPTFGQKVKDKKKPFVSFDPRSADFGKMRFGNTFIDPLTGLAQVTVVTGRIVTAEKVSGKGNVMPLTADTRWNDAVQAAQNAGIPLADLLADDPEYALDKKMSFGGDDPYTIATRFMRSKFGPVPGAAVNWRVGEDLIGNEVVMMRRKDGFPWVEGQIPSLVTPLNFGNVMDLMEENGVAKGAAFNIMQTLGFGAQVRLPRVDDKENTTDDLLRENAP